MFNVQQELTNLVKAYTAYYQYLAEAGYLLAQTGSDGLRQNLKRRAEEFCQILTGPDQEILAHDLTNITETYQSLVLKSGDDRGEVKLTTLYPLDRPVGINRMGEQQIVNDLLVDTVTFFQGMAAEGMPTRSAVFLIAFHIDILEQRAAQMTSAFNVNVEGELKTEFSQYCQKLSGDLMDCRDALSWGRRQWENATAGLLLSHVFSRHAYQCAPHLARLLPSQASYSSRLDASHNTAPVALPADADETYWQEQLALIATREAEHIKAGEYLAGLQTGFVFQADGQFTDLFLIVLKCWDNKGLFARFSAPELRLLLQVKDNLPEGVRDFLRDLKEVCENLKNLSRFSALQAAVSEIEQGVAGITLDLPPNNSTPLTAAHLQYCQSKLPEIEALVAEEIKSLAQQAEQLHLNAGGMLDRHLSELVERLGGTFGLTTENLHDLYKFLRKSGARYEALGKHFDKLRRQIKYYVEMRSFQETLLSECQRLLEKGNVKQVQRTWSAIEKVFGDLDYASVDNQLHESVDQLAIWQENFRAFADFESEIYRQFEEIMARSQPISKIESRAMIPHWEAFFADTQNFLTHEGANEITREVQPWFNDAQQKFAKIRRQVGWV